MIYVTLNAQKQVGIVNENTVPPTQIWFTPDLEIDQLVKALREAQTYLHDGKFPRWGVK